MATRKQIEYVLERLEASRPAVFFKIVDDGNAGIGAALRILYEAPAEVTAGNISETMRVSTARVAVLLKKMSERGLITRDADANDARITVVRLSPYGVETARRMQSDLYSKIDAVIDAVGMEKLKQFIAISDEIRAALSATETL